MPEAFFGAQSGVVFSGADGLLERLALRGWLVVFGTDQAGGLDGLDGVGEEPPLDRASLVLGRHATVSVEQVA